MKYWKPGRYGLALSSALALGAIPAFGQEAAEAAATDEDVVELSPFVVETSKDVGYMATNSISGTRLNMAIKDVPLNLEVITSKFIQDTGATNLRDALRYSAGMVLSSQADAYSNLDTDAQSAGANDPRGVTRTAGDSTTKLRGFEGDNTMQDGFKRVFAADTINIERVEVLRGPSALLYGTGNFGGVVNFITKKAIFDKDSYHFGVTVGRYGFRRAEMDINMPLASEDSSLAKYKPAFRLSAAYENGGDATQYYDQEHWQVNGVFSFKPFETTTVTLGAEFGYKNEIGVGFQNIRCNVGSEGAGRNAEWATDVYDSDSTSATYRDVIGHKVDTRTFRWSGDDTYLKGPYQNFTADIEQKLGENAYFKIGYSHSRAEFNSRQITAWIQEAPVQDSTRQDALYSEWFTPKTYGDTDGKTYTNACITYYWVDNEKTVDRDQLRAELMYKLDLDNFGVHTFIVGASYEKVKTVTDDYRPVTTWVETYEDENGLIQTGTSHSVANDKYYSYKSINDLTPFVYGTQGDGVADNEQQHYTNTYEKDWDLGYYACYQAQFFNDKLSVVGGLRWDRVDSTKDVSYPYANSLIGSTFTDGKLVTYGKATEHYNTDEAATAYSPSIGLNYSVTDWLSVYGVYSTGVTPNFYAYDGNGEMLDPTEAENVEFGVKFDAFDGKLSGTFSYYQIKRTGSPYNLWWAPNPTAIATSGFDADSSLSALAMYYTPTAFATMFQSTDFDGDGVADEHTTAYYQKVLDTLKSNWPSGWWPYFTEIYDYCVANPTASLSSLSSASFGTNCDNFWGNSWKAGSVSSAVPADVIAAINEGHAYQWWLATDYYFPLVVLDDADTIALMKAKLNATGWCGNTYVTNGQDYLTSSWDGVSATNTTSIASGNNNTNSGAYVAMDDKAKGWDMQLTWTPFQELQVVFGFTHLNRKVTTKTYKFVSTADYAEAYGAIWYGANWLASDNAYGTQNNTISASEAYTNILDTATYLSESPLYGKSADDSPENTMSIWARYELSHMTDSLKGWAIGLGAYWEDNRNWYTGFMGSGNVTTTGTVNGKPVIIEYLTEERITVNAMLEYKIKLAERFDTRFAVNVDNVFDDKDVYGLVYASGRNVRFSASIDF